MRQRSKSKIFESSSAYESNRAHTGLGEAAPAGPEVVSKNSPGCHAGSGHSVHTCSTRT